MSTLQAGFFQRNLEHYPSNSRRIWYLVLSVAVTVALYYQFYVLPSVATPIRTQFGISLPNYIYLIAVSNALGGISSLFGGLADRFGRANLVIFGTLLTALLTASITLANSGPVFVALSWFHGLVEGVVLVATPALLRDFSPRMGRATAMAFWTAGPVGGSLLTTFIVSQTASSFGTWQAQYIIAACVGIVIALLCVFGLRELSPSLRGQIMTSLREKTLLEARAKGLDVEATSQHPWKQMLRPQIVLSAAGVSVFLLLYYAQVAYFPTYYQLIFHYPLATANGLMTIYWFADIVAAIVGGIICDRLGVRKPFMLVGTLGSIVCLLVFISRVGQPTDPSFFAWLGVVSGILAPVAFVGWIAGFTETVENINPALVATGMAINGFITRVTVVVSSLVFSVIIGKYILAGPWVTWWWVCLAGMIVFLPTIFLTTGHWSPARARQEIQNKLQEEGVLNTATAAEPA